MSVQLKMAFRSTLRNWRHSLATLSSVALGLIAVAQVDGYIRDVEIQSANFLVQRNMYGHLIIEGQNEVEGDDVWKSYLSKDQMNRVAAELARLNSDVLAYTRFLPIQGMAEGAGNSLGFTGYAYDVISGETMRGPAWKWNTIYGQPLSVSPRPKVLVGKGLAELLGCEFSHIKPSDGLANSSPIPLDCFQNSIGLTGLTEKGQINALDVEIEGIVDIGFRDLEDIWLLMPIEHAQVFYDSQRIAMIGVALKDPPSRDRVKKSLEQSFRQQGLPLVVRRWEEHKVAEFYRENTIINLIFRNFIFFIVVIVCALSLTNTITRSIIQRTREIGTLRAVGFKRLFIKGLFAWEGFFLGLCGSIVGIIGSEMISQTINAAGLTYVPGFISTPIPLRIATGSLVYFQLALTLTVISSFIAWLIATIRSKKGISDLLIHN